MLTATVRRGVAASDDRKRKTTPNRSPGESRLFDCEPEIVFTALSGHYKTFHRLAPTQGGKPTFTLSLTASGGNAPYHWSATGLPPGLSLSGGVITGTPTMAARFRVTVTVTDTEASPQSASMSFIIDPVGT